MGELTDEQAIQEIRNYYCLSTLIATAGQPTESQLAAVARAGYQVVINLGLTGEQYSLPDEQGLVQSLGITYIHIPVIWERPTRADLEQFIQAMDAHEGQKVFVHCAANYRVSAFMALYRIIRLGWPQPEALERVRAMDFPKQWRQFIDEMMRVYTAPAR